MEPEGCQQWKTIRSDFKVFIQMAQSVPTGRFVLISVGLASVVFGSHAVLTKYPCQRNSKHCPWNGVERRGGYDNGTSLMEAMNRDH